VLMGSRARKLKRTGVDLLAGRAVVRSLHPFMAAELGTRFDLSLALRQGLIPLVWSAKRPAQTLRAYVALYLREEVQLEAIVRRIEPFARFLEAISFSHAAVLNRAEVARGRSPRPPRGDLRRRPRRPGRAAPAGVDRLLRRGPEPRLLADEVRHRSGFRCVRRRGLLGDRGDERDTGPPTRPQRAACVPGGLPRSGGPAALSRPGRARGRRHPLCARRAVPAAPGARKATGFRQRDGGCAPSISSPSLVRGGG